MQIYPNQWIFFFANGNIFFHTKSYKVDFITAQYCSSRSLRTIITALEKVQHKNGSRGFIITDYHGDNEFDKSALKEFLEPALLHVYGRNEHVGPIACNGIPYRRIPIPMIRSLIEVIVDTMNAFPSEESVSETLSPSTVVEGKPKLDLSKYIIVFGAYALVYTDTNNSMKFRAVSGIALRRSNNAGGHYFLNLYSGKRIHGYKWRELPIDDYVISRAEELAEAEKKPIMHDGESDFEWGSGEPIEDIGEPIEESVENEEAGTLTMANQMEDMQDYDHIENDHMDNNNEMDDYIPMIEDENNDELPINNNNEDDNLNDNFNNNNEEGLDAVIEDNIVSDEDDIVDPIDEEIEENTDYCNQGEDNHEEDVAVVANIDDEPQPQPVNQYMSDRPRRTGAGAGVERLQLDPNKKGYTEKREFNLMNNGVLNKKNSNIDKTEHMMMQIAYDVIFTQMSSKPEL